MDGYKFRVNFLEEAKTFLDELDDKAREKIIYNIYGNLEAQMIKNYLKSFKMKFGSFVLFTTRPITDFLHFGIRVKRMTRLLFRLMD